MAVFLLAGASSGIAQTLDARVQRKMEELEKKGVPTTRKAIWEKVKAVPKEDNAAPLLLDAAMKLGLPGKPDARLPYIAGVIPPDVTRPLSLTDLSIARAWLARRAAAVQALSVALGKPDCLFLKHGTRLARTDEEYHFMDMRHLAQLLALKSHVQAGQGDVKGAIDAIADILKLSDFLRHEPTVVAYLSRLGLDAYAESAAGQLIGRRTLNAEQLERLTKLFTREAYTEQLKLGLASEIVMSRDLMLLPPQLFYDSLYQGKSVATGVLHTTPPEVVKAGEALWKDGRIHLDSVMFLEQMGVLIEAAEKPVKQGRQMEAAVEVKCKEAEQKQFIQTSSFVPPLTGLSLKQGEALARRRLLLTALAIEQERLKNMGRVPESLEGLAKGEGKAVAEDPFAEGALFRYRKLAKGYQLYSVAGDGADNGGVKKSSGAGAGTAYDIVVNIGR
ncbi:MAG TPA: hypothetical protein VGH19_04855 [Verrucomicrobiae bacterium]